MDFYALVRQKTLEHEFKPICIEHQIKLKQDRAYKKKYREENREKLRAWQREYEKTDVCKARRKRWNESEAGKESQRRRSARYIATHKDNPEWKKAKNEAAKRWYYKAKFKPGFMETRNAKARENSRLRNEKMKNDTDAN